MAFVPLYRGMKCAEGKFLLPSPRPFKVIFKLLLQRLMYSKQNS